MAQGLGRELGKLGAQVISGMARGVDCISQAAALDAGGRSYGVLGCGVDICYPKSNQLLYERLLQNGGVLSSFPPGTDPRPQNFPPRNRIVSGLADVVIVVEARAKSGTLITVDMALEQGREVYVVPGRITDRLSDGCNRLLQQGANVLLSPYDFMEEMLQRYQGVLTKPVEGHVGVNTVEGNNKGNEEMSKELRCIYETLDFYPRSIKQILERLPGDMQSDPMKINTFLMRLCLKQMAIQVSPGYFSRKG